MVNKIRITVIGALGKMGKSNVLSILEDEQLDLVAALLEKNDPNINRDISDFFPFPKNKIYFSYSIEDSLEISDIAIDFTNPRVTKVLLEKNKIYKKKLVIGTTNLEFSDQLASYADIYPILYSANFSLGMNIFFQILKEVARTLNRQLDYDLELIESHHRFKKDSPSGTAVELAKIAAIHSGRKFPDCLYEDKKNMKTLDHIGISYLREGSMVGYHELRFSDLNETFTISHQAYDRKLFSKGVVLGLKFLITKEIGLYSMLDVLNLD